MPRTVLLALVCMACSQPPPAAPDAGKPKAPPDARPRPPAPPDAAVKEFTIEAAMDIAEASDGSFTSGGKLPPKPPELALFRVVKEPATAAKDRAGDAKKRLGATDLASGVKVEGQRPVKIDGLDGFETGGRGTTDTTAVTLYQVVLYDAAATWVMQGRSSTDRFAWYKPAYEKMARSFKRRAP